MSHAAKVTSVDLFKSAVIHCDTSTLSWSQTVWSHRPLADRTNLLTPSLRSMPPPATHDSPHSSIVSNSDSDCDSDTEVGQVIWIDCLPQPQTAFCSLCDVNQSDLRADIWTDATALTSSLREARRMLPTD